MRWAVRGEVREEVRRRWEEVRWRRRAGRGWEVVRRQAVRVRSGVGR